MNLDRTPDVRPQTYLDSYALQFAPFGEQADERFFYAGSALMQRLDLLTHLTQFGDSAALVAGPAGSGKTTLLKRFTGQAINQWKICLLDGRIFDQAPVQLANTMGGDSSTAPETLLDAWQIHADPSHLLVIVVDNAERLETHDAEQLGRLLGSPYGERVRLILFGSSETTQVFDETRQQGLFPDELQVLEMPRLPEEETSSYLMYRMAVAGYSGESPFSTTEVRAICKAADGRPGEINRLAHESLLERQARGRGNGRSPAGAGNRKKGAGLAWVIAGAAVIWVVAYLGWQQYNEDPSAVQQRADSSAITVVPLQLPEPATPGDKLESEPAHTEIAAATLVPETLPEPPAAAADDAIQAEVEVESGYPKTPAERPVLVAPAEGITTDAGLETEPVETAPAAESHVVRPAADTPALETSTTPAPEETGGPHREAWLLKQPPTSYTLQLLGSRSEASVRKFIGRHHLDPELVAWYRGSYKGADWYVLLYGIYLDRSAATMGRDSLPAAVRKGKPWPRDLRSVQDAIRGTAGPGKSAD